MDKQMINTSLAPEVTIQEVLGDLQVKGWDSAQVAIHADPHNLTVQEGEDSVTVSCVADLDIRLPQGATLRVGTVNGDASFKFLQDTAVIGTVNGDLELRNVANVQLETVQGDLQARGLSDDLRAGLVQGDADIRQVQGDCHLERVMGDLELQNVEGEIQASVQGSARLRLDVLTGAQYRIQAQGNVHCYLPEDANLKLNLSSTGQVIKIRRADQARTIQQAKYDLTLGDGLAAFEISAVGVIYLFVEGSSWATTDASQTPSPEFSQQIAQQVEAQIHLQMEEMTRRMNEQMESLTQHLGQAGLSQQETERIVEQAMRTSERETARAEEKMRRAQEKLERKLEAQRRQAEQRAFVADRRNKRHSWSFEWPSPPSPPSPPAPPAPPAKAAPVSEEERLMILRMLEQKKITLEEADRLLQALEGSE
jgi:hypothetical protein